MRCRTPQPAAEPALCLERRLDLVEPGEAVQEPGAYRREPRGLRPADGVQYVVQGGQGRRGAPAQHVGRPDGQDEPRGGDADRGADDDRPHSGEQQTGAGLPVVAVEQGERQQPQSLTRTFAELEQDGLISRTPDERDRRQSLLALTPAGRQVLLADFAERDAWLASALTDLSETEREVLRLAGRLMDQICDR
ncbi:MarR family winged helix-turn-helix transcriptional regulator [Streptomyces sp. NPDC002514]|uniref:MarR family winged helix-turn-helix transcriptional regulator n=1 Tax=Streptomyces sp. NPDC001270 TaxID=3364554 RepID=UPI003685D12E